MSAKNPGMEKAAYATAGGFKPALPGKKLQMKDPPMPGGNSPPKFATKITSAGTAKAAAVNPKPAAGVSYGAKAGLHDAPKAMPAKRKPFGTLVD